MARFARRPRRGEDSVDIDAGDDQPDPIDKIACRFRVMAVSEPSAADRPGRALISGLLIGPFPAALVQLTIPLDPAAWPAVGTELTAVADKADPHHFGVTWVVIPASKLIPNPVNATQWQHAAADTWDHGPDGAHDRLVATGLRTAGLTSEDFGGQLAETAPGIEELLADTVGEPAPRPDQP